VDADGPFPNHEKKEVRIAVGKYYSSKSIDFLAKIQLSHQTVMDLQASGLLAYTLHLLVKSSKAGHISI
jgi:hypothetical protein